MSGGYSLNNPIFSGWGDEKPIYKGKLFKKGGRGRLGQFAGLRVAWQKRGSWCF